MVNDMVAYCGLICTECLTYQATQKDNDRERKEIADQQNTQWGWDTKPEDINCDGCLQTSGRLFKYCLTCEARKCGLQRGVTNCAYCDEYPCQKLTSMPWFTTKSKPNLDQIRESLRK